MLLDGNATSENANETMLRRAVNAGLENVVKKLLEMDKADVNAKNPDGTTHLHVAALNGDF